ncbi:response regulator [Natrinema sp. H-ect4]|uniref:response regulator n=1 Tax=Natrinema sp. H-ect4 TaxID=3242699 RepID=UPI0035A97F47
MSGQRDEPIDVLLVEDDDDDIRLAREAFAGLAIESSIRVIGDGAEALSLLTGRDGEPPVVPDLILLDLDLPQMDGLEFLEAVTAEPELARLPVLVLTRSTNLSDVRASYDLAANAYLTKPTEPTEYAEMADAIAEFWFRRAALPTGHS